GWAARRGGQQSLLANLPRERPSRSRKINSAWWRLLHSDRCDAGELFSAEGTRRCFPFTLGGLSGRSFFSRRALLHPRAPRHASRPHGRPALRIILRRPRATLPRNNLAQTFGIWLHSWPPLPSDGKL